MKMTDGKKVIEIDMSEFDGISGSPDFSNDFFNAGSLTMVWIEEIEDEAYKVDDLKYCIDHAYSWQEYRGDFYDPEAEEYDKNRKVERIVAIEELI